MKDQSKIQRYFSNGKLMVTGEYLVLDGAEALALPLIYGQEMQVSRTTGKSCIMWRTFVEDKPWFDACFSLPDMVIANTNDFPTAQNVRGLLLATHILNPSFPGEKGQWNVKCTINFNINWGLGSSSSLVANLSSWAGVDPFELHFSVSSGSGYDVAAAISDLPVIYSLKNGAHAYRKIPFDPVFKDNLYFGYLGKKRNSAEAVENFRRNSDSFPGAAEEITGITRDIAGVGDLIRFMRLLKKHDAILSGILNEKPLYEQRFTDFNGYVKSLGAWGGDFALFVTDFPKEYVVSYFRKKDIKYWFDYKTIIKPVKPGIHV